MLWTNSHPAAEYTALHDETSASIPTAGFLPYQVEEADQQASQAGGQSSVCRAMYVMGHIYSSILYSSILMAAISQYLDNMFCNCCAYHQAASGQPWIP